jgi:hypothetical protein
MNVFISGSIGKITLNETEIAHLTRVIASGETVLIGDAYGVDTAVQRHLAEQRYPHVTVYFSGETVRNNIGNWPLRLIPNPENLTGRSRFQLKDKAMAHDCDYALMFWNGKSKGTQFNMSYIAKLGKNYLVVSQKS